MQIVEKTLNVFQLQVLALGFTQPPSWCVWESILTGDEGWPAVCL